MCETSAGGNLTRGRLLIVAATLLWSTSGFFAKAPLLDYWPPHQRGVQLAFWRVAFASLLLVLCVRRIQWTWRLVPAGISFALMNICYLMALTSTTAANAIWIQYTAPAWVLLVGVLWLGERATSADYWMLCFCAAGVLLIIACEYRLAVRDGHSIAGVLWALASGVTFAAVILTIRALRDLDSAWVVAVCHISATIVLLPWIFKQGVVPTAPVLGWMVAFGMLQLGLPYLLFARGTRVVTAHEAAFIGLLEPLFMPLWAFLFWHDKPAVWTVCGGALILCGLIARFARRRDS